MHVLLWKVQVLLAASCQLEPPVMAILRHSLPRLPPVVGPGGQLECAGAAPVTALGRASAGYSIAAKTWSSGIVAKVVA